MSADLPPLTLMAWLRHDLIWSHLDRLPPTAKILEIGAGQGAMGARIASRFVTYVGVEADPVSAGVARTRVEARGGTLLEGELAGVEADGPFDAVCAFEVLEHIDDDTKALHDWRARLRPGGLLLLSVPAWPHRFGPWDELVGHYRRYEPAALARLLGECGFAEVSVRMFGFPLGYLTEPVRNRVARRRLAEQQADTTDRTAASGRLLQASGLVGRATRPAIAPFRLLQRALPTIRRGTGIVAAATRAE